MVLIFLKGADKNYGKEPPPLTNIELVIWIIGILSIVGLTTYGFWSSLTRSHSPSLDNACICLGAPKPRQELA